MRTEETPSPPLENIDPDNLVEFLDFLEEETWLAFGSLVLTAFIVGALIYAAFRGLAVAGKRQPPVVVVVGVLGIVLVISLVVLGMRPELGDSLTVIIGSGIGALGGAVVAAFDRERRPTRKAREGEADDSNEETVSEDQMMFPFPEPNDSGEGTENDEKA